jgi:glycosyltransferase involved in cell wall biosynthesis
MSLGASVSYIIALRGKLLERNIIRKRGECTPPVHAPRIGNRVNILFLLDHLGYAGGAWHGRTAYLVHVLPQLKAAGHNVELCVLRDEHPAAERLRRAGIEVTCLGAHRRSLRSLIGIAKRIGRKSIDVLHVTQRESSTVARTLRPFLRRTAVIMHIVDSTPVPRVERQLNRLLPQPDVTLCVSSAVRPTAMQEYGVAERRLQVLHNAIDLTSLKPSAPDVRERLRAEWGVPRDSLVVASTSRFGPEKRLDVLIKMLPAILEEIPRTVLVFAGLGEELERCRALTRRLGVEQAVRFLGHRNDVADVLAASDVEVMLCLEEAFGFSAVEALALGVPVVAYAAGGLAEIIVHEQTGLLADAKDDDGFRRNLVRLLQNSELRERLSAGARKDARRFEVGAHADALTGIYQQSVRSRRDLPKIVSHS